jgi:hypothetical protein
MRIGASLLFMAIGAILKFGVTTHFNDFAVGTIGVILMTVGALGLIITLFMLSTRRRTDVVYGRNGISYIEPDPAAEYYFR